MSKEEKEDNLEQTQEYRDKLFRLYESKSNSFRRVFGLLMGFALIFLFVIFLPYYSIQIERADILNAIKFIEKDISIIQTAKQNLVSIMDRFTQTSPNELRNFITGELKRTAEGFLQDNPSFNIFTPFTPGIIIDPREPSQTRLFPSPECEWERNVTLWTSCETKLKVESQLDVISENITENVNKPLQDLHNKPLVNVSILEEVEKKNQQDNLFEDLKKISDLENFIGSEGNFTYFDKVADYIEGNITASFNFTKSINTLNQSIDKLDQRLPELKNETADISRRISQIQFPFGNLPVGLNEAIAVFPIALAIGTLIYVSELTDAIRLRKDLDEWYQKKYPNQSSSNKSISDIAPLWVDPIKLRQKTQMLRLSILIIPFVVFILIFWYQISMGWAISSDDIHILYTFPGGKQNNMQIFLGLYIFSSGIFIYSCWRLTRELYYYKTNKTMNS